MRNTFDLIVVGLGAMGSSTCYHLAKRGVRVLGLEQYDIPHTLGSSHGQTRMIRMAYYERPEYVPLLHRSYALWDEIEQETNIKLLHRVGGIFMGPSNGMLMAGAAKSAKAHALDVEILASTECRRRWPQFVIADEWEGLFDPQAGFLRAEQCIAAYAIAAMRKGAELHGREAVLSWRQDPTCVTVKTVRGEYQAGALILAGGPWSGKLLADLGLPLVVTRQVLGWVWPRQPELFEMGRFPVWGIDAKQRGGIYYGFPMLDNMPGLKLAHHVESKSAVDPNSVDRTTTAEDEEDFRIVLRNNIPAGDGPLLSLRTCLYTNTPDGDFIIDRHPEHSRVQFACGFSGHGFKFASVVGEILAERAIGDRSITAAEFLRLRKW